MNPGATLLYGLAAVVYGERTGAAGAAMGAAGAAAVALTAGVQLCGGAGGGDAAP